MPYNYKVEYSTTANTGTWVELDNVQDISFSIGRQFMLDQYSASTGSLTVRYPTGYATPNTAMVPGTYVRIWGPNTTDGNYAMYHASIKDVSVTYGIPYAGGVGQADYLNVTLEGGFAEASRMSGQNYAMAAGDFYTQCNTASIETGLVVGIEATSPQMAASTVSGTWGDWINASLVTINGRMADCTGYNFIDLSGPYNPRPDDIPKSREPHVIHLERTLSLSQTRNTSQSKLLCAVLTQQEVGLIESLTGRGRQSIHRVGTVRNSSAHIGDGLSCIISRINSYLCVEVVRQRAKVCLVIHLVS